MLHGPGHLWSPPTYNEEGKALAATENGSLGGSPLTLGTCLPLDFTLCEALGEGSLDKDFFEQFVDLNDSLGDVPELDFGDLLAPEICPADVAAPNTYTAPPTPDEFVGLVADADCTSMVPQLPSPLLPPAVSPSPEITVLQTSDSMPASPDCHLPAPPATGVDNTGFEKPIDFDELFKILENPLLSTSDSTDIALPNVQRPVAESSGPSSPPPPKRAKRDCRTSSCESASSPAVDFDKCSERRRKNNIASKHARAARKERENNLFLQEKELEQSNAELRVQVEKLTKEAEMLRKLVIERLSKSTTA